MAYNPLTDFRGMERATLPEGLSPMLDPTNQYEAANLSQKQTSAVRGLLKKAIAAGGKSAKNAKRILDEIDLFDKGANLEQRTYSFLKRGLHGNSAIDDVITAMSSPEVNPAQFRELLEKSDIIIEGEPEPKIIKEIKDFKKAQSEIRAGKPHLPYTPYGGAVSGSLKEGEEAVERIAKISQEATPEVTTKSIAQQEAAQLKAEEPTNKFIRDKESSLRAAEAEKLGAKQSLKRGTPEQIFPENVKKIDAGPKSKLIPPGERGARSFIKSSPIVYKGTTYPKGLELSITPIAAHVKDRGRAQRNLKSFRGQLTEEQMNRLWPGRLKDSKNPSTQFKAFHGSLKEPDTFRVIYRDPTTKKIVTESTIKKGFGAGELDEFLKKVTDSGYHEKSVFRGKSPLRMGPGDKTRGDIYRDRSRWSSYSDKGDPVGVEDMPESTRLRGEDLKVAEERAELKARKKVIIKDTSGYFYEINPVTRKIRDGKLLEMGAKPLPGDVTMKFHQVIRYIGDPAERFSKSVVVGKAFNNSLISIGKAPAESIASKESVLLAESTYKEFMEAKNLGPSKPGGGISVVTDLERVDPSKVAGTEEYKKKYGYKPEAQPPAKRIRPGVTRATPGLFDRMGKEQIQAMGLQKPTGPSSAPIGSSSWFDNLKIPKETLAKIQKAAGKSGKIAPLIMLALLVGGMGVAGASGGHQNAA
tara:strand:+ start:101 stop:2191 length:2091 start_codon:yes stop_codon:yes gene_type:complete